MLEPIKIEYIENLLYLGDILSTQAKLALIIIKPKVIWILPLLLSLPLCIFTANSFVISHS